MSNTLYDISCYTNECLSIGKTHIGNIIFNTSNIPPTCNCTILSKIDIPFPNIMIDKTNKPTEIPKNIPILTPKVTPKVTPISTTDTINTKKNTLLLASLLLINIILML